MFSRADRVSVLPRIPPRNQKAVVDASPPQRGTRRLSISAAESSEGYIYSRSAAFIFGRSRRGEDKQLDATTALPSAAPKEPIAPRYATPDLFQPWRRRGVLRELFRI